jgi:hypothetical protein
MYSCPRSYGIRLDQKCSWTRHGNITYFLDGVTIERGQQLAWFIRKGDLLLSNTLIEVEQIFAFTFRETDARVLTLYVFEYLDDDPPSRYQNSREGK